MYYPSKSRYLGAGIGLAVIILLAVGCSPTGAPQNETKTSDLQSDAVDDVTVSGSASDVVPADVTFVDEDCRFSLPDGAEVRCGTVTVPMDWDNNTGEVNLAVAVFSSTASDPAPDPVVYLEGGPGGHALEPVQFSFASSIAPLLERGDVVLFDQRGAGLSTPRLNCTELRELARETEDDTEIDDEASEEAFHTTLNECYNRLKTEGIDLNAFNSVNNAHDVEAIRVALGYDQWNLFGVSYGTRLGLEVLRQHPDGVRAAVLDSVFPPEVNSVAENPDTFADSLDAVVDACQAEPACAEEGNLQERFTTLAQDLQAEPRIITVQDWLTGESSEVALTGDSLVGVITQGLYSPSWFTDFPELATDLEAGNTAVIEQFGSQIRTTESFFTDGMFYAFACGEEISFANKDTIEDPPDPFGLRDGWQLASNTGTAAEKTCEAFPVDPAPAVADEPVVSDKPVLLMAGAFDPVTPVSWAESARLNLANSQLVIGPYSSHGVSGTECGLGLVIEFLDNPDQPITAGCLAEETLTFVGPGPQSREIELESFSLPDNFTGQTISGVRPEGWEVGVLGGDQYRQASFLDPTQLYQLGGTADIATNLANYFAENNDVELSDPVPFTGTLGESSLSADDLDKPWRRRSGVSADGTVAIEWFETDTGQDSRLFVILVSAASELDANVSAVLAPAVSSITIG